jgi:hypothetical protein
MNANHNYLLGLVAQGDNINEQIDAGSRYCYVRLPQDFFLITQVKGCPHRPSDEEGFVEVPFWWLKLAHQLVFGFDLDTIPEDAFAADNIIHIETLSYALEQAVREDFHKREDGTLKVWHTVEAFAYDFGLWGKAKYKSVDSAPATLFGEDLVSINNEAFPDQHAWLNQVTVLDMQTNTGNAVPYMRLHVFLWPSVPTLDLSDPLDEQSMIASFLAATATECFPALARASLRMAITKLLGTEIPYQILPSTPWGFTPQVGRRMAIISLLAAWASPMRNEQLIIQDHFSDVLVHYQHIAEWVGELPDPYAAARQLLACGWGDTRILDLAGLMFLNDSLNREYDGMISDERSCQENFTYILAEFRRRRAVETARDGRGGARGESGMHGDLSMPRAAGAGMGSADGAHDLARLSISLTNHFEGGKSVLAGMELIFHSGAVPAIRFLLGHGVQVAQLPPIFYDMCRNMPTKKQEYAVDSLRHKDDGNLDPEMQELAVMDFLKEGDSPKKMNAFYNNLFDGKFSLIDWEKDLVYPIAKMLDPNAKRFANMADVWADPTRRAMHVTYVGRLLDCIGKRQGAPLSLSSIVGEWEPVLAKAQTRGAGMTQDALREIKSLMEAVWRNAESVICASYTTGAPWINGLIEPDLSALVNFRSWCDDLAEVARMSKKFRGTFAVRTATHHTSSAGWTESPSAAARGADCVRRVGPVRRDTVAAISQHSNGLRGRMTS